MKISSNDSDVVTGITDGRGVVCFTVVLDSGELITLSGDISKLRDKGKRVRLAGSWQSTSNCQQGRTFRVTQTELL